MNALNQSLLSQLEAAENNLIRACLAWDEGRKQLNSFQCRPFNLDNDLNYCRFRDVKIDYDNVVLSARRTAPQQLDAYLAFEQKWSTFFQEQMPEWKASCLEDALARMLDIDPNSVPRCDQKTLESYREARKKLLVVLKAPPVSTPTAWEGAKPYRAIKSLPDLIGYLDARLIDLRQFCNIEKLSEGCRIDCRQSMQNALRVLDHLGIEARPRDWPSDPLTVSEAERKLSTLISELQTLSTGSKTAREAPSWNAERREILFEQKICKRYNQPAKHQERILAAFQEQSWPQSILDPLPGEASDNATSRRKRLNDAITGLNRALQYIRFHTDGTGQGICWEKR